MRLKRHVLIGLLLTLLSPYSVAESNEPDDVFEPFNRFVFSLNDELDGTVVKPLAKNYKRFVPQPVRFLVGNFFNNLTEPRNFFNDVLQARFVAAGSSAGRFVINSTVGMLGMLDVASTWGLKSDYNDFGLTLGRWGFPGETYIVLPLVGSNTIRSAIGIYPDASVSPKRYVRRQDYFSVFTLWGIQARAGFLKQEDLIVGDKYTFIRNAYLQHRQMLISGKIPEDDF